jgi:bacterioferritin
MATSNARAQVTPRQAAGPRLTRPGNAAGAALGQEQGEDQQALVLRHAAWRKKIIDLLNKALEAELVCVLRYKRLHFAANVVPPPRIARAFLLHANEESAHADRLAQRIADLGGEPDFSSDSPARRSRVADEVLPSLRAMVASKLKTERAAIETYHQALALLGDSDATTRELLQGILGDKQRHAQELERWAADRHDHPAGLRDPQPG